MMLHIVLTKQEREVLIFIGILLVLAIISWINRRK